MLKVSVITRVLIQKFRCLTNVDMTFHPLTILVGPNGSGKSSVLAALGRNKPLNASNAWRKVGTPTVEVSVDEGPLTARDQLTYSMQLVHFDIASLRRSVQVQEEHQLHHDGSNLANVFATLTRGEQEDLARRFSELVPMYQDVVARPGRAGEHRLVFQDRWSSQLWYEPQEVSDGSMLLLALLVLQYQTSPIDVLAVEEPERGLHPYLIGQIVDLLRRLATGKLGPKPIQVIVATHSAELLEFVQPHEVRFLSRDPADGATKVEMAPSDSTEWAQALKDYQGSLGSLWLSGAVGGVPGN